MLKEIEMLSFYERITAKGQPCCVDYDATLMINVSFTAIYSFISDNLICFLGHAGLKVSEVFTRA